MCNHQSYHAAGCIEHAGYIKQTKDTTSIRGHHTIQELLSIDILSPSLTRPFSITMHFSICLTAAFATAAFAVPTIAEQVDQGVLKCGQFMDSSKIGDDGLATDIVDIKETASARFSMTARSSTLNFLKNARRARFTRKCTVI
jgi:hypothetical protein